MMQVLITDMFEKWEHNVANCRRPDSRVLANAMYVETRAAAHLLPTDEQISVTSSHGCFGFNPGRPSAQIITCLSRAPVAQIGGPCGVRATPTCPGSETGSIRRDVSLHTSLA